MPDEPTLCQVSDLTNEPECLRMARWSWQVEPDAHPVLLCNFHAEPLLTPQQVAKVSHG